MFTLERIIINLIIVCSQKEENMFSFENDYSEGACPQILKALNETNYIQVTGYGLDQFCEKASKLIKKEIQNDKVDVHFVPGGTPCNTLVISLLKPYEAVICPQTGHINVHETGSVEASGHKILAVETKYGKLSADQIQEIVNKHTDEHMVKPRMVFISNPTELGTIYNKKELAQISKVCKENNLYLYLDGARLGSALVAETNDLTMADICKLVDAFYIGGTKNGALYGEALIIVNNDLKPDFRYLLKQRLSMMAKSRVMGVEFMTLFTDGLYYKLAKQANFCCQALKLVLKHYGIKLYCETYTNQIFAIVSNKLLRKIKQEYVVSDWAKYDENNTVVRFVCSWNTKKKDIKGFYDYLKKI